MENVDPQYQQMHPNLARLAVRYDDLYKQWQTGRITGETARALMANLSERDDQGTRWTIDPDTGRFVRQTAFNAVEYDTPPSSGVLTPDPFAYSAAARSDDPSLRLQLFADESMQRPAAPAVVSPSTQNSQWWRAHPWAAVVAVLLLAAVVAGIWLL